MSALDRLAERMFGRQRLETTAAMASVDTQTYIGVATSDSADGSVSVVLSDDVTQPDNGIWDGDTFLASDELGTSVELPTTTAVRKGDRVLVTASGANVLTAPVVTGVVGRGDEQQAQIDAAAEAAASVEGIAQEALDVAEATGQHFWSDTDGIHVTEVTEEEWNDSAGSDYHSGANVLINALGQLFRDGLNNLLAVLPTGIAIYDGQGNAQTNIVASFTQSLIELGKNATTSAIEFCGGIADLAYRGTSAILRSKTGSAGIQSGTGDLYSTTQAALMASALDGLYDGVTHIDLHTAKPRLYAIADSVYLLDTTDPYTLKAEVDMTDLIHAFTTTTHNVTLSNITFSTAPVIYLQRRGNLVSAKMMSVVNARTANSQIYVGTIPTGFRPTSNVAQTGICVSNNNFNGNYKWVIDSLGGVTYLTSVTGAREAPLVLTWFTKDDWQDYS